VIGSGPGGEGAAMQAVKHGKQVAVVERFDSIGGGCTHWGTIPSKALRYAIVRILRRNAKVTRRGPVSTRRGVLRIRDADNATADFHAPGVDKSWIATFVFGPLALIPWARILASFYRRSPTSVER
jgi:NADPH-dependent 2,4-dienoyl-CoA reductase/sulfur reductase-like enzyme